MASSLSVFEVDDQTDEDFFDKLVDDDFGPTDSAPEFIQRSDSDDAKAFANLTIGDDVSVGDDFDGGNCQLQSTSVHADPADINSANPKVLNSVPEPAEAGAVSELKSHLSISNSSESTSSGFKVLGWNSFNADSTQNMDHGFGSYSDFFNELPDVSGNVPGKLGENSSADATFAAGKDQHTVDGSGGVVNHVQYQDKQEYEAPAEQTTNVQDLSWENAYPGWKFDANTQQWYAVDTTDPPANSEGYSDVKTEVSYMQQASQSVVSETSTSQSVANLNQQSDLNGGYPQHMVFDPQYPGWYYDTIAQEWRGLDTYTPAVQSTVQTLGHQNQNGFTTSTTYSQNDNISYNHEYRQADNYVSSNLGNLAQDGGWAQSFKDGQKNQSMWQAESMQKNAVSANFTGFHQSDDSYNSRFSTNADHQNSSNSFQAVSSYERANQGYNERGRTLGVNHINQPFNQQNVKLNEQGHFSNEYYGIRERADFSHQSFQSGSQYSASTGRSMDGRPPHALVTFGFGGKLIVMKENTNRVSSSFGNQGPIESSVSVLNLQDVVTKENETTSSGVQDYFRALWQQSFPGPLVGGNVGSKELNKWIDERIANWESSDMYTRKAQTLKVLLSLLKIACQHYGKLRSPFGSDIALRDNDSPESAVAKLFANVKASGAAINEFGQVTQCLQKLPSEAELRGTASEVQKLLVSGRKREALQYAQDGQLWGFALVLASQLGDQFYVDTIKQMAVRQLAVGSPLRTLCLLIADQPTELFPADTATNANLSMTQQPTQFGAGGLLDDWEENLAVITANRTKNDELVIIHLGDCLWKERGEVLAAHICYLVAEAVFESYSESTRLCLIGADHLKFPRTYASPEAIQRTELYEYSKVLGNSQFTLLQLQPYKLVYAHMLAEVGKVSDSLKYCQAILKSLKIGRAPEVEMWKQLALALEERNKTHQQGGYGTNLAPAKLVGKLLNFFDSTAHRVVGGLPPPAPSASPPGGNQPRVSTSQSTMAMSSLMASGSMEHMSEWAADGNRMTSSNRSISEPDFGRTPRQDNSSKENAQGKASASRLSRFGFGSQLLQKTVGLVLKPRPGKQAKLGEQNKFYYDEKLKRWVEEGAALPTEEVALPPPPTTVGFQNGTPDYNLKSALKKEITPSYSSPDPKIPSPENSSGMPPMPPTSNQFAARGRMGVRSRYVDTFNPGGGRAANSFQSPSVPAVKPAIAANTNFFVPSAVSNEQAMEAIAEHPSTADDASTSMNDPFQTPTRSQNMQRYPSMGNIPSNGSVSSHSRRTASWGGSLNDSFSPPKAGEVRPLGEVLGMPASSFMPGDPSLRHAQSNGSCFSDLQEVEL